MISTAKQARAAVGKDCVKVPAGDDPEYMCFEGTKLVGNSTNSKFVNGSRYTVSRIGERVGIKDDMMEEVFETSLDAISKRSLLAWAMVYNKVQGATESGTVMLHDTSSRYFKKCHLYVGLSRATSGSNVFVSHE